MVEKVSFWGAGDPELERKYRDVERQQRLAMMLQNVEPDRSSWNSMRVVPSYGWGQGLTHMLGKALQGYSEQKAEAGERELEQERSRRLGEAMQKFTNSSDSATKMQAGQDLVKYGGNKDLVAKMLDSQLKREELRNVGKDEQVFDPTADSGKGAPLYTNVAPEKPLDPVAQLEADFKAGRIDKGTYEARKNLLTTRQAPMSVNVNTAKGLYETMAEKQGGENVALYQQAQKAPELLQRAQRVKSMLGPESQAITGAGAEFILGAAKVANTLGFNTGDAAADTEALARDLAASTLDGIKASGLGAGSGFSNADRDFLEKVVGGKITLEAKTLQRLADLNEKTALATIQKWNATASRLDNEQLKTMGMSQIEMPQGTPPPASKPKLIKNPDGSYQYSP